MGIERRRGLLQAAGMDMVDSVAVDPYRHQHQNEIKPLNRRNPHHPMPKISFPSLPESPHKAQTADSAHRAS